ncbi:MAG: CpsD/CapB family tyrosine-protein kinase [Planctomycetota bacterium]
MKKHLAESSEQDEPLQTPADPREQHPGPVARTAPSSAEDDSRASSRAYAPPSAVDRELGADYAEVLVAHHDRGSQVTEEYRGLRTSLLAQNPEERFCYMITSGDPGEGKTVTCANLGVVLAERADRTTLLVDFDLRKGRLAELLHADHKPGVAELLQGQAKLEDIVQRTAYPNLFFIPCGSSLRHEVGEIAGDARLEALVNEMRATYDFVLFDTPPMNVVSDAAALGRVIGKTLVVVRMEKTERDSAEKAIRLIHAVNGEVAGLVLTARKRGLNNYRYYRYKYYR